MAGNDSRTIGKWGEEKALEYLKSKGYTIAAKGFRSRFGEIDIIAKNKDFLTFVEVKTRKDNKFAHAREYVSKTKQMKISATARYYLMKRPTKLQPRFDVIEIYAPDGQNTIEPEFNHIINAYEV